MSTYKSALVQTKAYRILREHIIASLESHGLTMSEWTLIGLLFDTPDGLRLSQIAAVLRVEAPLITVMIDELSKKNIVVRKNHPNDKRAKLIFLTPQGKKLVPVVEKSNVQTLNLLFQHVDRKDIDTYQKVLEAIIQNGSSA